MKLSFPFFLSFLAVSLIWLGQDASAKLERCTDRHSVDYCRLIFHGR
jgi:hypothetical protein